MDRPGAYCPVLPYLATQASTPEFMLVDIGCAGGIEEVWWTLGPRLRALAIDPDAAEIDRLRREEARPGVEYLAAFAALRADHPFARGCAGRSEVGRTPWARLAVARTARARRGRAAAQPPGPPGAEPSARVSSAAPAGAAPATPPPARVSPAAPAGAAPAAPPPARVSPAAPASAAPAAPPPEIDVPDALARRGIASVDFVKIDIDGKDFEILQSFASALDSLQILGLLLEVNFHGSAADTDHTLHNTDRFMKAHGFELFNLTTRRYSMAALPGRYLYGFPAEAEYGRLLQGDALYVRDLASPEHADFAAAIAPAKLLNLVRIFAAFDLPDCAAEVVLRFDRTLAEVCDTRRVLDLLAAQAQGPFRRWPLTYREYMSRFEAQHPMFFPPGTLARRALGKAWRGALLRWWRLRAWAGGPRAGRSYGRGTS